jgi:hypothetical protein
MNEEPIGMSSAEYAMEVSEALDRLMFEADTFGPEGPFEIISTWLLIFRGGGPTRVRNLRRSLLAEYYNVPLRIENAVAELRDAVHLSHEVFRKLVELEKGATNTPRESGQEEVEE